MEMGGPDGFVPSGPLVVLSEAKDLAVVGSRNGGAGDFPAPPFLARTTARSLAALRTTGRHYH
jgi:hypothetical protein